MGTADNVPKNCHLAITNPFRSIREFHHLVAVRLSSQNGGTGPGATARVTFGAFGTAFAAIVENGTSRHQLPQSPGKRRTMALTVSNAFEPHADTWPALVPRAV